MYRVSQNIKYPSKEIHIRHGNKYAIYTYKKYNYIYVVFLALKDYET